MNRYLILQHPGHNRVFYKQAGQLALAELTLACQQIEANCKGIDVYELAGVRYLHISCEETLTTKDITILSRLSFLFAMFELKEEGSQAFLIPMTRYSFEYIDPKISSLLKYAGKTNEHFTRMMINVAMLSSKFSYEDRIKLLDPVAGKGTTLYEGAIYGFDTYGIEAEEKSVHAAQIFFKKYLEAERYKHLAGQRQVAGKNKGEGVFMKEFEYARTKDEFKHEASRKRLALVSGKSQEAQRYFKKDSFHLIVGDLPYGIAHKNRASNPSTSNSRNPAHMLRDCLGGWYSLLKEEGIIVLAWNTFVMKKKELIDLFRSHGLHPLLNAPYDQFMHTVDKSIKRDILVARKTNLSDHIGANV